MHLRKFATQPIGDGYSSNNRTWTKKVGGAYRRPMVSWCPFSPRQKMMAKHICTKYKTAMHRISRNQNTWPRSSHVHWRDVNHILQESAMKHSDYRQPIQINTNWFSHFSKPAFPRWMVFTAASSLLHDLLNKQPYFVTSDLTHTIPDAAQKAGNWLMRFIDNNLGESGEWIISKCKSHPHDQ